MTTPTMPTAATKQWLKLRDAMNARLRAPLKGKSKKQRREAIARALTMELRGSK